MVDFFFVDLNNMLHKSFKIFLVALIVYFLIQYYIRYRGRLYAQSVIDQKRYLVRDTVKTQEAADTLASINQRMTALIDALNVETLTEKERIAFGKNVALLRRRYRGVLHEGQVHPELTSFTVNKGQETEFCLRPRDNDHAFYDLNLLTFVAIHEAAHMASVSEGHGAEFKAVFKFLLEQAVRIGIYQKHDFKQKPVEYCGLKIHHTPL